MQFAGRPHFFNQRVRYAQKTERKRPSRLGSTARPYFQLAHTALTPSTAATYGPERPDDAADDFADGRHGGKGADGQQKSALLHHLAAPNQERGDLSVDTGSPPACRCSGLLVPNFRQLAPAHA